MARFFIETNQLFPHEQVLRFEYEENADGTVSLRRVSDPIRNEQVSIEELKNTGNVDMLANISTAYMGNYERTYIE